MKNPNVTIKSWMITFLTVIALHSIISINNYNFLIQLVAVPIFAALIDMSITYIKERKTLIPNSAIISGLLIASILPLAPIYVLFVTALIAILSKYIIKFGKRHIFNPAAFGIIIGGILLGFSASWWSAISILVVPFGLFIIYKQRKWLLAFSFLAPYFLLIILSNLSSPNTISLLDTTAIFFAFFMLIEPMTSAYTKKAMIGEGIIVAVLVALFRIFLPEIDLFLTSLLIANIFVAILNNWHRKKHQSAS